MDVSNIGFALLAIVAVALVVMVFSVGFGSPSSRSLSKKSSKPDAAHPRLWIATQILGNATSIAFEFARRPQTTAEPPRHSRTFPTDS